MSRRRDGRQTRRGRCHIFADALGDRDKSRARPDFEIARTEQHIVTTALPTTGNIEPATGAGRRIFQFIDRLLPVLEAPFGEDTASVAINS